MKGYWTEFGIGIIMIASPWLFGFSDVSLAKWCNVLIGLLLVIMSGWVLFGERPQAVSAMEDSSKAKAKNKNSVEQK
jgi:SPW repeat